MIAATFRPFRPTHAYQEANPATDSLAQMGWDVVQQPKLFVSPPPHVVSCFRKDVMEITSPRLGLLVRLLIH